MKTDELIAVLVADQGERDAGLDRRLAAGAIVGAAVAALAFSLLLGWRPDVQAAFTTPRFVFKLLVMGVLAGSAWILVRRLVRPDLSAGRLWALPLLAPALLGMAAILEMILLPAGVWGERMIGTNAVICLVSIPLLAIAPLAGLLLAMRRGAPSRPVRAGIVAGLMAGGIAAFLYGLHCDDDSPLFVIVWYTVAVGTVVLVAGALGSRLLRW